MIRFRVIHLASLAALSATPTAARDQERDFMLGARAYLFAPLSADESIMIDGARTGTRLNPSVSATGEVNVTYMVTDSFAIEGSAAITRHRFHTEDGALSGLGSVVDGWFVPLTLTAQYRHDTGGPLTPYVGVGANVMFPLDFETTQSFQSALGPGAGDVDVPVSYGWVAQAGMNYTVNDRFYLNLDAKIVSVATDMTLSESPRATYDLRMTPIIIGFGLGYRF